MASAQSATVPLIQKFDTSLPGVWELRPKVHSDSRGFFLESYHAARYAELGIYDTFVQDNQSFSIQGTLRGLHYQLEHPQAKLCRVVEGSALDVVVDIRRGSPQFGKWTSIVLSAELGNQLYVPPGFAHGFLALSERIQFLYKCSDYYCRADEYGIIWNDPELAITWKAQDPLVSDRDARHPRLSAVPPEFLPIFQA
ncbi:MAG TPA: dTDP-4-dehydrorhamnose 3,5-epimerase [Bryobacteraceae bacterium]|nr:dTDP-4-dehydrorhamnose 3,5-epimerase [Bryobacteraceae bacterium]